MNREITPEEAREFAENVFMVGPDYASDLAACFEALSHFSGDWDLRCRNRNSFECEIYVPSMQWYAWGTTPQQAIIKAVNAAARARSK